MRDFSPSLSCISELSHPRSFSSFRRGFQFRGNRGKNSFELCRSWNSRPNSHPSSSVTLRVFVSLEGFPLGMEDMKLQRHWTALALPRVGYPGVFYFACRPRCYLVRYVEILTNLSPSVLLRATPTLRDCCP